MSCRRSVHDFFSQLVTHADKSFLRRLFAIALPITLQSMMFSSRSLVDVLMLGQLGEAEIAAVGVAARATFVTTIMLLGVTTGGALLTAQYWGAGNKVGVRQSTSLTWMISMVFAALTVVLFVLFPEPIMRLTTDSEEVIRLGADYLVISSVSMFAVACVASMAVGLRAMHQPGLSTFLAASAFCLISSLTGCLFLGNLAFLRWALKGLPLQPSSVVLLK